MFLFLPLVVELMTVSFMCCNTLTDWLLRWLVLSCLCLLLAAFHEVSVYPKKDLPFFILFTAGLCSFTALLAVLTHQYPEPMGTLARVVRSLCSYVAFIINYHLHWRNEVMFLGLSVRRITQSYERILVKVFGGVGSGPSSGCLSVAVEITIHIRNYYYFFIPSVPYDPKGFLQKNYWKNVKMGNWACHSVQSQVGKQSCSKTALKRCIKTEQCWKR